MFDDCVRLGGIINYSDVEEGRVELFSTARFKFFFQFLYSGIEVISVDGEFRF